ncbi:MAG: GNAT family N-acetyltransferase [Gaiellaceae bacterium]
MRGGLAVRRLTPADAEAIAGWRYPGRESTYDELEPVTPERGYWAVTRGDELVGKCCFGAAARVPGVEHEEGTLDVGYGLRPDLVGQGLGPAFVQVILDFAAGEFAPRRFRVLVLDWNRRSLKVAAALGFREETIVGSDEGEFVVLVRPAPRVAPGDRVSSS